jgi:putative aldouronate transport system substrate-binding protein
VPITRRKLLTLAPAAGVALVLAGCTPQGAANGPKNKVVIPAGDLADKSGVLTPSNPTTLTVYIESTHQIPAAGNKLTKLLKDKLGVTLKYELVTPENSDQKIGVMLAGGDYPDLIGTGDLKLRFIEGGALTPLDSMLKTGKYPNVATYVKPYIKQMSYSGTATDKGLYILPNYNRFFGDVTGGTYYGAAFWIQKRVLADAGYPDLSNMTVDKYFQLISDYKAKHPTTDGAPTVGFEAPAPTGSEWILTNPPAMLAGSPNNGGVIVDKHHHASIYANKATAKNWYKALNARYNQGLVDPETFTLTNDQFQAKLASGAVLGMQDQGWQFGNATSSLQSAGKDQYTYVPLMPVNDGVKPYYADRAVMNINQGFGVSSTSKQKEQALKFLDMMLSEPWQKVLSWGVKGQDYEVGSDGKFTRTDQQRAQSKDLTWQSENKLMALLDMVPKHNGTFSDGNAYSPDDQPTEFYATLSSYDKAFMQKYNKKTWMDFVNKAPQNPKYYPAWNIKLDDAATQANQQMTDAAVQNLPKIIAGKTSDFDKNWKAYTNTIGQIDVKSYEDAINKGIQYRLKNW